MMINHEEQSMSHQADWFHECKWGVFCHYLGSPPSTSGSSLTADDWNRQVDAFDARGLAAQLESVGARYFFITIGQGSGHYLAPNRTYDRLTGIQPSKCSERDLVADLYTEFAPRGIRLLVYSTTDGSWADRKARAGLGMQTHWNDGPDFDWSKSRNPDFLRNWEAVNREWSKRWGNMVAGWWIDGCYHADVRFPEHEEPNFHSFARALRAGNQDAIIAFNPGVKTPVICCTDEDDFTAGEVAKDLPECPGRWVRLGGHRAQYHVLTYLGEYWCKGEPRFPDEMVVGYTKHVTGKGGVITWDVPIAGNGLIPAACIAQLGALRSI